MASGQDRSLKNPRVRRMLMMIDDTDNRAATCSGSEFSNIKYADIVQENKSNNYDLRDLPKKKYTDSDREGSDVDFSPDCSDYVPSPERIVVNSPSSAFSGHSGNSHYIDKMLNNSKVTTPSAISNLSLLLNNSDFVASSTIIYKINNEHSSSIDDVQNNKQKQFDDVKCINAKVNLEPRYPLVDNCNLSSEKIDETLQPENFPKFNEPDSNISLDVTLTDSYQHEHSNIRTDLTLHPLETEPSNLDVPSTSQIEKIYARKRKVNEDQWSSKKNKILKNAGQAYEGCHNKNKYPQKTMGPVCTCKKNCGSKFTSSERQELFDKFYKLANRESQWIYIIKHTKTENIKRITLERKNNRTQTIKYFFPSNNEEVLVCKKFFLNTLQINEQMVYTAIEKFILDAGITDLRGKHNNRPRKMSSSTASSIEKHIALFPKIESHYTRKSSTREYLSQDLNISKMYRLYTDWFPQQNYLEVTMATKRQYEIIFNTKYNYSFFKPKKDQCSTCFVYEQASPSEKESLEESYRHHLNRKERIRQIKDEEKTTIDKNDSTIAIFDLQKVLSIPQSSVGIFHYKRKYPVYNFTIFDALRKKGYCYVWHYQIAKRGCIEIGSCLLQFLKSEHERGVSKIYLYSDGCYGQNKNRFIFALYAYAAKSLNVSITHRFFETGHSQNEGDSMHACIERNIKNKLIYTPEQMYNIIINSKISGEKYTVKEMEQKDILDIKRLVKPLNWRYDKDGNTIRWSDVMEVHVSSSQKDKVFFKYDFDEEYAEINILNSFQIKRRGRKPKTDTLIEDIVLERAYHQPFPISKALHTDLMSLCNSGAILRYYHPFYESLISVQNNDDDDKEQQDNDDTDDNSV